MNIPAIETRYNGFHFRSRLEARWAVFFDVLGIKYEHEPEKFDTPAGRYIPDFGLRGVFWRDWSLFEVKGPEPTPEEIQKAARVRAFVGIGAVNEKIHYYPAGEGCCPGNSEVCFYQCILCGHIGITCAVHGSPDHDNGCPQIEVLAKSLDIDDCFTDYTEKGEFCPASSKSSPMLRLATEVARSDRFESPNLLETVETYRRIAADLKANGSFGNSYEYQRFNAFALAHSRNPHCPRYVDRAARKVASGKAV